MEIGIAVENFAEVPEIVIQIREVTCDESRLAVASQRALEDVDHAGEFDNVRLIVEAPLVRVHQPVVVRVHGLVHPDGVGYVQADGHVEFTNLFPDDIHASVVRMHFGCARFS